MTTTPDMVNAPPHYQQAPHGIAGQPFDYFPYMDGIRSTGFRYVWRAGFKVDTLEDLNKALACVRRDISHGNDIQDKPGHLTHQLTHGTYTLRRAILTHLWNRHDLTRTAALIELAIEDPGQLEEEI